MTSTDRLRLLFPASFTYVPNLDGAEWFFERVYPLLRMIAPTAEVVLAGAHPPDFERFGLLPGVTIAGQVESMSELYDCRTVVFVPLLGGSGSRVKILEAWAHGVPVVSTSKGAAGLEARAGEHLLIADEPEAFAAACAAVMDSPRLWRSLAEAGHNRIVEAYSWEGIVSGVRSTLRSRFCCEGLSPLPDGVAGSDDPTALSSAR